MEPSPSFVELLLHYLSCMKGKLATECTSELTEKTTLPQVMIKVFNLCEKKLLLLRFIGFDKGLSSL